MLADDPLERLANSVSDGAHIDWDRAEIESGAAEIRGLWEVERIAEFSRSLQRSADLLASAPPNPPAAGATTRPEHWGDLTLLERIGAGSNGEVWRAWDATLQREVALKFLQNRRIEASGAAREILLDEARALARIRHRGVVTVYGIAEHGGRPGMWMELLQGPTLAEEIARRGALHVDEVVRIGLGLCSALDAVDRAGLVHRDLKPANIVLELDGRVVLTDFGLGWRRGASTEATPRGWGTPAFMSPELMGGAAPSHGSDLYALGVTLRWALTGRPPFQARDFETLRTEARGGPTTSLSAERPDAPAGLIQAIALAMAPRAVDRVTSAQRLAPLLQAAAGERGAGVASVAVLPFVNRGRNEEDEYFSDGLADDIRSMLAKIRGLKVAARTSSSQFKGTKDDLATIGKKLNVATLLEGTVRKSGESVRISVHLSKVSDGYDLWAETYDRTLDDIFTVQDDIAQSVVRELRETLLSEEADPKARGDVRAEVAQAAKGRGTNPEAHRLCLQARHFGERGNRDEMVKAYGYLEKALEIDPAYAPALALLGRMHMREADMGWVAAETGHKLGREFVERALSLEPDLPEGHAALGWTRMCIDWDWSGADASFRRAQELMPGNTIVLCYASSMASNLGRLEEAIELANRALDHDPLSSFPYITLGLVLSRSGRFSEAEEAFRRGIELSPQRACIRAHLALALLGQGRRDEALADAMQEPERWARLWALAIIHHTAGRPQQTDDALRELIESEAETAAYQIASVYAIRHEVDSAFEWLERAYSLRDTGLAETKSNPHFRPLHGDPRWTAFLTKVGFQ
jgi:serine/threonine protein kinase/tetratricopeptide (TPR) repeat protein